LDSATKAADKKNGVKERVIPESTKKAKASDKGPAKTKTTDEAMPKTPAAPKKAKKAAKAKAKAAEESKESTAKKPAAKPKAAAAAAAQKSKVEHPPAN
jgi:histone H1/5